MANASLSSTAWVLHDLGLAAGFGGNLFGSVALDPSASEVVSREERGRLLGRAWMRYLPVNATALALTTASWFVGRGLYSGREVGRGARGLVIAKDAIIGTWAAVGIAQLIAGGMLAKRARRGEIPAVTGVEPAMEQHTEVRNLRKVVRTLHPINLALAACAIGTTAVLATLSSRSARFSLFSRLMP